jgi:NAD(P)-dependent dehydrogenase (short-subunit alcohol dehydrogenase family)
VARVTGEKGDVVGLLTSKVALVTGGGNGIGRGIALQMAKDGAAVGVLDRDPEACHRVATSISEAGQHAIALPADVSNAAAVNEAVRKLADAFGAVTVLAHTAGIMPEGTIDNTSEGDWDRVFSVNVKGAYLTCREVIPHMRRAGGGSIILMASITGVNGFPGLAAYSSTKGALIALARAVAIDHAQEAIRANSVSPGTIDSPMLHEFVAKQADPKRTREAFDEIQPRGRVGTIDEVVNVVTFLASDLSTLVSGTNIIVDGGASVKGDQPRL